MSGAFWNIRGIKDFMKRLRVSEKVKEYNQDFIGFSETKAENVPIR
jgi:exonuclease III